MPAHRGRRVARAGRADRQGRHPHRGPLRRAGAAAVDRVRAGARARGRVPRRADRGARPAGPAQPLGPARRAQRVGRTVVLTTHYMDEAETLCDRVAIMDHGRILQLDTPQALVRGLARPMRISVARRRRRPGRRTPRRAPSSRPATAWAITSSQPGGRARRARRARALHGSR